VPGVTRCPRPAGTDPYHGRVLPIADSKSPIANSHPEGVVITVWVVPGSSRDVVGGFHDGSLRVRTTAPAEGGKANRAVARLVASHLGADRAEVLSGHSSRRKRILVRDMTRPTAERLLAGDSASKGD